MTVSPPPRYESLPSAVFAVGFAGLACIIGVVAVSGCQGRVKTARPVGPTSASLVTADALMPSPRLLVGRVLAVELPTRLAFVEVASSEAPAAALSEGADLVTRRMDLQITGHLRASRYIRGRTLGTTIVSGEPTPGDEVVWLAP